MVVQLDEQQEKIIHQYLANIGMENYADQVLMVIMGHSDPGHLLRLLYAFYRDGVAKGGLTVEEAWNSRLKKLCGRE